MKTLSSAKQQCMDRLLETNSEGAIMPDEKAALEELVAEAERLMVVNAKMAAWDQAVVDIQRWGRHIANAPKS